MKEKSIPKHLLFYDGDCGFCNSSVQFVLDKKKAPIYFLPLQSSWAEEILAKYDTKIELDTIYYLKDGKLYDKSSAALQITRRLKGIYPILFSLYAFPKFLRDPFYNFIAKRRHKIRNGYCMLPSQEDQAYFLKTEA